MRKYFIILLLFSVSLINAETRLILNVENAFKMPRNFRTASEWGVKASASGQFSEKGLTTLLEAIPSSQVIIIDLCEESHGFINGAAVSWRDYKEWTNRGYTSEAIEADQEEKFRQLHKEGFAILQLKEDPDYEYCIEIEWTASEKQLVAKTSAKHIHMPTGDHLQPSDSIVDQFLELVDSLNADQWLHFHCSAGKGRSSTFLVMYDILKNARHTSLNDILSRQKRIGGSDFLCPVDRTSWKYMYLLARRDFLARFYQYCLTDRSLPWSHWITTNNKDEID